MADFTPDFMRDGREQEGDQQRKEDAFAERYTWVTCPTGHVGKEELFKSPDDEFQYYCPACAMLFSKDRARVERMTEAEMQATLNHEEE